MAYGEETNADYSASDNVLPDELRGINTSNVIFRGDFELHKYECNDYAQISFDEITKNYTIKFIYDELNTFNILNSTNDELISQFKDVEGIPTIFNSYESAHTYLTELDSENFVEVFYEGFNLNFLKELMP